MRETKLFHIIWGKLGVKVSGKGWGKYGKRKIADGEKWVKASYPPIKKVIPKVIHTVFHVIDQSIFQKSTASTITTNTLISNRGQQLIDSVK